MLYRKRWKVELFFKWVKQHLHIKAFFGTTPNAVKIQLWTAVIAYVLVHRAKYHYGLSQTPNQILQILGGILFEKTPINEAFSEIQQQTFQSDNPNQLQLFDFLPDSSDFSSTISRTRDLERKIGRQATVVRIQ